MKNPFVCHRECAWSKNGCVNKMLDDAGVPNDPRWRSLILYFRAIADYPHLTDSQKSKAQRLIAETLAGKDFSDKRLAAVLKEYYGSITESYTNSIEELLREAAGMVKNFKELLVKRCGDLSVLEETTVLAVEEGGDEDSMITRLRGAFGELRTVMESDIHRLDSLAMKDALTGLGNRRSFDDFMQRSVLSWLENQIPLGLAIFDIDYFKKFNDTHGHRIGDQVLIVVGKQLSRIAEKYRDASNNVLSARYGGEEFVVAVSGSGAMYINEVAEEIRRAIRGYNFLIRDTEGNVVERGLQITVSGGVCTAWSGWKGAFIENMVDSADKALYYAKEKGRDRCAVFSPLDRAYKLIEG
ncbi:GGDEF domain-containing protein [Desulfovibrio sp. OttesenSCG-928-I05]|nr:GGDEF domain-containing protein [Desulfovibrio sp. OttesenSCG-928-I05]